MNVSQSTKSWIIIIAVLLLSGLVSGIWYVSNSRPAEETAAVARPQAEPPAAEVIEIRIRDFVIGGDLMEIDFIRELDGAQIGAFEALGIITLITLVALAALTLPLVFIYVYLDRQALQVKAAEEVKQAQTELEKREQERIKALRQQQPAAAKPDQADMPRWAILSTSMIILLFVIFTAQMLGRSFLAEELYLNGLLLSPTGLLTWALVLVTVVVLFFVYRQPWRSRTLVVDATANAGVPWAWIWVVISGLLVVGVGLGLSLALFGG